MMKKYVSFAAAMLLLTACSGNVGYEITGTVNNVELNGKYVYLVEYGHPEAAPLDSALVENGTFRMEGTQEIPALRILRFAPEVVKYKRPSAGLNAPYSATFVLENASLTATLDENSTIAGSTENDAQLALQQTILKLEEDYQAIRSSINAEDEEAVAKATNRLNEIEEALNQTVINYITNHNDWQTAAVLFSAFRYELSEEVQNNIVAGANDVFKSVPGIDKMIEHLEKRKEVAVGKKFTDFEMADTNGKMHKLSEYVGNGKLVLIDFWASWCAPCRAEMPNLVRLYAEYKAKGFEIVGISLDNDAAAWEKGIKTLGITWTQLSDLQGWKNAGAAIYAVNSIPHTVLVGADGTILAKDIRGEAIETEIKKVLD